MAYTATFLNHHEQFGKINVVCRLIDDAVFLPSIDQWMKFPSGTAQGIMDATATAFIARAMVELVENEARDIILNGAAWPPKYQTKTEFADRLRAAYKLSSRETTIRIADWLLIKIIEGEFTDTQVRNAFNLTAGQWTTLKAKMTTLVANYNAVQSAQGE